MALISLKITCTFINSLHSLITHSSKLVQCVTEFALVINQKGESCGCTMWLSKLQRTDSINKIQSTHCTLSIHSSFYARACLSCMIWQMDEKNEEEEVQPQGHFTLQYESGPWKSSRNNSILNPLLDLLRYFNKLHFGPKRQV